MRALPLLLFASTLAQAGDLIVAAASDLAPMTADLEAAFQRESGTRVRFTLGSSGSLARQIENGAPFDVYLSASDQYVNDLARAGKVDSRSVVIYATGRIALWSASGAIRSLEDLREKDIRHVAIPNPEHAPYGIAARRALQTRGLWKEIEPKIVYAENVRQALQFAESRNAEAVITSWTLLNDRGILLPAEWHDPIRQSAAVVASTAQPAAAVKFLNFLKSPAGRKILQRGGLFVP